MYSIRERCLDTTRKALDFKRCVFALASLRVIVWVCVIHMSVLSFFFFARINTYRVKRVENLSIYLSVHQRIMDGWMESSIDR